MKDYLRNMELSYQYGTEGRGRGHRNYAATGRREEKKEGGKRLKRWTVLKDMYLWPEEGDPTLERVTRV